MKETNLVEISMQNSLKEAACYKYALEESCIVSITDQKGIISHVNDNFCIISKYSREELIGQDHHIINSGYHSKNFIHNLWTTISNGKIWKGELKNKAKDGTIYWVDTTIVPFLNEQGNPYQYIAIKADITDLKRVEGLILNNRDPFFQSKDKEKQGAELLITNKELAFQNDDKGKKAAELIETLEKVSFLASIADNIQDLVITSDNNSNITRWNHSAEKLLEWKSEEVIGRNTQEILNVIYGDQSLEQIRASYAENGFWQGEVIYHTKSGRAVNVIATASKLKDTEGNVTGSLILVRDITERIKAEKQLKEFEHFFNNSNDISGIANTEGYFEILNPSFEKILGYSKNELSENPFLNFVHPDDVAATLHEYENLKSGATVIHFSNRYRKKDGNYLWFDWNATPNPVTGKLYCIARDITERKKAEDALSQLNIELDQRVKERTAAIEKNEKHFRALIENSYDVISLMDASFRIVYRSPSAYRITGWSNQEIENLNGTTNIHPDDLEYAKGIIQELMAHPGQSINTLFRNQHKSGHYLWMEGTVINLLHEESIKAIVFNFRDVTQRKKLEDLLNKANTLARIGGWEVDLIKETVFWSDITREIHETEYSYIPDLATGLNFYIEGEGRDLITQKVNQAIQFGKPWDLELEIITAKNNIRWIRTIGETEFVNGKCVKIYGSFQDIDQRKKAEEKIIKSEKLYRNLFTNMLHGFAYCKAIYKEDRLTDFTYLAVNSEYEILTGLKGLGGKNMSEVIPNLLISDPAYAKLIDKAVLFGESEKFETYVKPLDKWFSVSLYSPEKGYFVSLVDDITGQKKAAAEIEALNNSLEKKVIERTAQLEAVNKELESFSYSVSHDLRTPLRAINGYAKMVEEDYSQVLDDEGKRWLEVIQENAKKMGKLIDDLLAFSRLGKKEVHKSKTDMTALVNSALNELNKSPGFKTKVKISTLHPAMSDTHLMNQVWVNLLSNAIKYSFNMAKPLVQITSEKKNGEVIYAVSDNGVGFDMQYVHKLFGVFQRLHDSDEFEGTGVGLALVHRIITKHGGKIWANGELGKGATFYFSLPDNP